MRYAALFLALILMAAQSVALPKNIHLKTPGVLSIYSYEEFTPVSYGQGQGYEADILRALAKKWRVKLRFQPTKVYEGLWRQPSQAGSQFDLAIGGISPMPYRRQQGAVFTQPTAHFAQSLLVRTEDYKTRRIRSYNDFKRGNFHIGVVPGTTGERYARQRAKEAGLKASVLVEYPSEKELLAALKSRKIDAIARGEIGNEYQASIDPSVTVTDKKDFGEGFAFVVDPKNKALLEALNAEIDSLTCHGKRGYSAWLANHKIFITQTCRPERSSDKIVATKRP